MSNKNKKFNNGVKSALNMLHQHINSMDHAAGFVNSEKAREYTGIMKSIYNNISTLIKK